MSRAGAGASDLQAAVDASILAVGGYWRPIAALARVLEEMGELAELVRRRVGPPGPLESELADVYIVTTCLANQFRVDLRHYREESGAKATSPPEQMMELLQVGGVLARTINYYDGPKTPRRLDSIVPVGLTVARIHALLRSMAGAFGVDLESAVLHKAASARTRDGNRFVPQYNPSTAPSAAAFTEFAGWGRSGPVEPLRLWGAQPWCDDVSVDENVRGFAPHLETFTKASPIEGLDGFVVQLSVRCASSRAELTESVQELLAAVARRDPARNGVDTEPREYATTVTFNGLRLPLALFSPLYGPGHPMSAPHHFVLFQTVRGAPVDEAPERAWTVP